MISLSYNNTIEFVILLILEMILGMDNLIFISITTQRLPYPMQNKARICGLSVALIARFVMLALAAVLLSLKKKLITVYNIDISYRDMFMIIGGGFLIYKSLQEIFLDISEKAKLKPSLSFSSAIGQIIMIDLVLSLDSVISGIGITNNIVLIGIVFFIYTITALLLSKNVCEIIWKYSNIKTIAILFIGTLGGMLILDGFGIKISNSYLYSMLVFSVAAESINLMRGRKK